MGHTYKDAILAQLPILSRPARGHLVPFNTALFLCATCGPVPIADSALMYKLRLELVQFLLLSLREKTMHHEATLPRRELESSIPARRPGSCQQSCAFADSAIAVPVKYGRHIVPDYLRSS